MQVDVVFCPGPHQYVDKDNYGKASGMAYKDGPFKVQARVTDGVIASRCGSCGSYLFKSHDEAQYAVGIPIKYRGSHLKVGANMSGKGNNAKKAKPAKAKKAPAKERLPSWSELASKALKELGGHAKFGDIKARTLELAEKNGRTIPKWTQGAVRSGLLRVATRNGETGEWVLNPPAEVEEVAVEA